MTFEVSLFNLNEICLILCQKILKMFVKIKIFENSLTLFHLISF